MTPENFKSIRKKAGLTQVDLALILGRTDRMIRHYESGNKKIPKLVRDRMIGLKHGGWSNQSSH